MVKLLLLFLPIISPCCCSCVQDRDVAEGADMLMVKPGMTYLDIARQIKDKVYFLEFLLVIINNNNNN